MTRPFIPWILAGCLAATYAPAQVATFPARATSSTVQGEMVGRYLKLDARVNGKPAKLIVDTGAGMIVLTPRRPNDSASPVAPKSTRWAAIAEVRNAGGDC